MVDLHSAFFYSYFSPVRLYSTASSSSQSCEHLKPKTSAFSMLHAGQSPGKVTWRRSCKSCSRIALLFWGYDVRQHELCIDVYSVLSDLSCMSVLLGQSDASSKALGCSFCQKEGSCVHSCSFASYRATHSQWYHSCQHGFSMSILLKDRVLCFKANCRTV